MDLARRLAQIVQNNNGTLLFVKAARPATGWVTIRKMVSYQLSGMTAPEIIEAIRSFLSSNILVEDGIALYRRSGNLTLARITLFATQADAELAARAQTISHIVNVADNTVVQVGDFTPDVPGDGGV